MEPKRALHSGNLVRDFHVGDRKLFMEKYLVYNVRRNYRDRIKKRRGK